MPARFPPRVKFPRLSFKNALQNRDATITTFSRISTFYSHRCAGQSRNRLEKPVESTTTLRALASDTTMNPLTPSSASNDNALVKPLGR